MLRELLENGSVIDIVATFIALALIVPMRCPGLVPAGIAHSGSSARCTSGLRRYGMSRGNSACTLLRLEGFRPSVIYRAGRIADMLGAEKREIIRIDEEESVALWRAVRETGGTCIAVEDAEMIAAMRPGSVVVDMAADAGGNVEGTVAGESVITGGPRRISGRFTVVPAVTPPASFVSSPSTCRPTGRAGRPP